jgi:hypothetical protein
MAGRAVTGPAAPWAWKHAWPVLDDSRTRAELEDEAQPDLDEQLAERLLIPIGPPAWRIVEHDRQTWPDTDLVLVAEVPVVPGLPTREQWPALIEWAAGRGWTDRTLAGLLGLPEATVAAQRRRAGVPGRVVRVAVGRAA